ncbi:hypothetical protein HMPREF9440_02478 [Sutterella parvirubra YIT 11816]|uniref:Uncharacterized protein n=1 Tax=Sutterella parvirubra YIT 11816 TaxID=762967 RepID=H3KI76_9BURK|nr:hypothetical protein HMPREF9440_02478 [Sutterella parvirubra YIT 11816]
MLEREVSAGAEASGPDVRDVSTRDAAATADALCGAGDDDGFAGVVDLHGWCSRFGLWCGLLWVLGFLDRSIRKVLRRPWVRLGISCFGVEAEPRGPVGMRWGLGLRMPSEERTFRSSHVMIRRTAHLPYPMVISHAWACVSCIPKKPSSSG